MSPLLIARNAYDQRNNRPPLDTIMAALGLDRHPRVHTHGAMVVNRYAECLDAFREVVEERGGYRAAMPDNRFRLQRDPGPRVRFQCANPACDYDEMWPRWKAERQDHCCMECSLDVRYENRRAS